MNLSEGNSMLIPIVGLVVVLVLLVLLVTSRYKVAGPNQAFIVTGRKGKAVLNPETGQLSTDLSGPEGRAGRRGVRDPVRAEALQPRPVVAPHLGADPRRGLRARASS